MKSYLQILRESKLKKEEAEQISEISKALAAKAYHAFTAKGDEAYADKSEKGHEVYKKTQRGRKAAYDKYHGNGKVAATEEVESIEESDDLKVQRILSGRKIQQDAKEKAGIPLRRLGEGLAAYVTRKAKAQAKMKKESVEGLSEGRPSQAHPLEGHDYHKKSNDQLEYIRKDAHTAAEAMKDHNTTAENKYRDQASDASTVLHFRKKNGTPDWYKKKYGHTTKEGYEMANISSIIGKLTEEELSELFDFMMEEVEALDEISKGLTKKVFDAETNAMDKVRKDYHAASRADDSEGKKAAIKTGIKRSRGQETARAKLAGKARVNATESVEALAKLSAAIKKEEVEQIDELSKKTLGSYVKKADKQQNPDLNKVRAARDSGGFKAAEKEMADQTRKAKNRTKGVYQAIQKYSMKNEEVELFDEEADLTKIHTKTLQSMVQLHKHMGQKNPASKAAADRGQAELDRRMKKEEVEQISEISRKTLYSYSAKAAAQDGKRVAGEKMADEKIRKAHGYSSDAKVAATKEEVEISEKKDMSKGDIAALAGHKGKIDKEDFAALRNKEHLKKEEVQDPMIANIAALISREAKRK